MSSCQVKWSVQRTFSRMRQARNAAHCRLFTLAAPGRYNTSRKRSMTYRGRVTNGQITLDQSAQLPEGAEVNVEVLEDAEAKSSIWDKLRGIAGTVEGPEDWARNHDHYIHGTPKRP